ncbi:uncharacterized protein MYCFIDRAFT_211116 [Pseudocercospora fijiensis CIRAD86]|uniref:DNA2/NAM7 helicase-like C-terminal domain-containing protein n=1 Tax=Pseudocercospora fijiensis (strain CIRAD86) TaxID=383855 RepID=M3ADP1_PSEFD|nr:uncharacterized protein MYCFIDRAFT_211116 [Pseudocercospora fijiensis CIRAD86]EME82661.1 hypothetical protein MYCFIDRAFT_211116 [Pseudocercospora fijiensis CIRAD86]
MVIAFYTDQVELIKAILKDAPLADAFTVTTVDGAQGQESKVTIIDAVMQGAAFASGMNFIGADKRRFNVAMSRAQVGRIIIANQSMVTNPRDKSVWRRLIEDHEKSKRILQGGPFNQALPDAAADANILANMQTFQHRAQPGGHQSPGLRRYGAAQEPLDRTYAQSAFIRATYAPIATADIYLRRYNRDLPAAIDRYLAEHGDDGIAVENIP